MHANLVMLAVFFLRKVIDFPECHLGVITSVFSHYDMSQRNKLEKFKGLVLHSCIRKFLLVKLF